MSNAPIRPNFNNIPQQLRSRAQWVNWKFGQLKPNGKRAKVPFCPTTGKAASTTDPATWATFEQALATYKRGGYTGIGYILTQDDPFTFIDLDNCIRNGEMDAGTVATIKCFGSYAEISVNGQGAHILVEGKTNNRKNERAEVYSDRRFIAMTGAIIAEQRTIQPRQCELDTWAAETFPAAKEQPGSAPTYQVGNLVSDDDALFDAIYTSKQASKFAALMAGDTTGYKSHSEADAALCSILAFWTNHDGQRIDRIFRLSGLMRPKWDRTGDGVSKLTYGQLTIANALRQVVNGYKPPKNELSQVEQLCNAWRVHFAGQTMHSATQRVLLATLRKFEQADDLRTPISSRNIADLTGLSHKAAMMHLRLLCPQIRNARMKQLQAELNRADAQLRAAGSATTAEETLLALRPNEREGIVRKVNGQGEGAVMAEVMIYLNNRRDRATGELRFYAKHPAIDILDIAEAHDGSAFATVFTLRTLQNLPTNTLITVGGGQQHSDHDLCGNNLQSSDTTLAAQQFVESNMADDAFVVVPPTKLDPRLKLEQDPVKRARLAKLLDIDAKLKPFGLSAPRVFAHLDGNPDADIESLMLATGVSERTIRTVLKATGLALVEDGYLPLVESTKTGRKNTYRLADDWRERLDALRPDLATDGVVLARAVHHAGERIQRINAFLEKGMRDRRRTLDDATRAQYEAIKARAQQLKTRILGSEAISDDKGAALDISNDLVGIEAAIVEQPTPAVIQTVVQSKPLPIVRLWLGSSTDSMFGVRELIGDTK